MKLGTEKEKKWAAGILAWFGGETLSTKKSKIRKEETKSKEKKTGTLLQRPISINKTTLPAKKKKGFAFSAERTAGGHLRKIYSDPKREISLCENAGQVWPAALGEKLNSKQQA